MSTSGVYTVDPQCIEEFKKLKLKRKYKWLIFHIIEVDGQKTHTVQGYQEDKSKSVDDLIKSLSEHSCCYIIYEHEYKTNDGRSTDKLFFITWNPRAAATSLQMDYLTGRSCIREICDGCFDISATTASDVRNGILGGRTADSSDEEEDNEDWMN